MENVTKDQARAAMTIVLAVSETIRELGEVPSGVLYAQLVGCVDLGGYTKIIDMLKGAGLVEEKAHVLRWVGPAIARDARDEETKS